VTDAAKSIALVAHSEWRVFLVRLCALMRERYGSVIHLYCVTEQERHYYEKLNQDGLFASITNVIGLMEAATKPVADPAAVLAQAAEHESRLGTTFNILFAANRHFGRGFSPGGFRHPRSRYSESSDYLQIVAAYNETVSFWETELREKQISLVLSASKELSCVARALGVPTRNLIGSRYKNYHMWVVDEFMNAPRVAEGYAAIDSAPQREIAAPYDSHMQYRKTFMKSMRLRVALQRMGMTALRHLYWRIRRYEKGRQYFMRDEVLFHWRVWRANRSLTGSSATQLDALDGKPFVFFPLHAEPESSLQVASPECLVQLSTITSLARDLPAGYYLAVKETYQTYGRRPSNFYDQIREFKNVVLLDMLELGLEVARRAEAVATITGTAGFEAAVMGKPVISFGRHNQYNVLPHVTVVDREEDLAPALRAALIEGVDRDQALRDGARFLQAVLDNSFDMAAYDINDPETVPAEILTAACDRLVESLEPASETPMARAG
tara:strand:- start:63 stop:1550 length:1488 start_codon:yes stop_codon:yes gene_type:complete